MIKLSERLGAIARFVDADERVADIGTDHAHIPIFLWQNHITRHILLSDLNEGPLQKADENIRRELGENPFALSVSNGLQAYCSGEIDTAIIAGMGGLLIRDILSRELPKTRSIKKLILQPRNAQATLRHWLFESGFRIYDELLVREGNFICEIIAARPDDLSSRSCQAPTCIDFEISPILFQKKDPLLYAFLTKKIEREEKIANATRQTNPQKYASASLRIKTLSSMLTRCHI